jgi:hypothetical protein
MLIHRIAILLQEKNPLPHQQNVRKQGASQKTQSQDEGNILE